MSSPSSAADASPIDRGKTTTRSVRPSIIARCLGIVDRYPRWLVAALLAMQFGLGYHSGTRLSITHDEYWHLPAGVLWWQAGRSDGDVLNPPFTRLWAAVPVWWTAHPLPEIPHNLPADQLGDRLVTANPTRFQELFVLARGMNLLWCTATGALLAVWAWRWFGRRGGCLAAWMWVCCPNALAHGSLVTPDMGLTFWWLLTLYLTLDLSQPTLPTSPAHPDRSTQAGIRLGVHTLIWGVALGLSQATKFTAVLLYPLTALLIVLPTLVARWRRDDRKSFSKDLLAKLAIWMTGVVVSLVVLNGVYLFRGTGRSLADYAFESRSLQRLDLLPHALRQWPLPVPRDYLTGLDRQRRIMEGEHPVFLDKEWSLKGIPRYYIMTLVYKLPHAVQILGCAALVVAWRRRRRSIGDDAGPSLRTPHPFWLLVWLGGPTVCLLLPASFSGMQLGLRYVLPMVPLLILWISQLAEPSRSATTATNMPAAPDHSSTDYSKTDREKIDHSGQGGGWRRWGLAVCVLVAPLSLRHHPHHLTYFNELAGGPIGGRWHLVDSNLDWGQGLLELREYLRQRGLTRLDMAYFGTAFPQAYGIPLYPPPTNTPQPGWYAVSVNFVMGRPHALRYPNGHVQPIGIEEFGYFRGFTPVTTLGNCIDIYHLTPLDIQKFHQNMAQQGPP